MMDFTIVWLTYTLYSDKVQLTKLILVKKIWQDTIYDLEAFYRLVQIKLWYNSALFNLGLYFKP